jgi:hypothetical protein
VGLVYPTLISPPRGGLVYPTLIPPAGGGDAVRAVLEAKGGFLSSYDMSTASAGVKLTADLAVGDGVGPGDVYGHDGGKYAIVDGAPVGCGSSPYISKALLCSSGAVTAQIGAAAKPTGTIFRWGMVEVDFTAYNGSPWFISGGVRGTNDALFFAQVDTGSMQLGRDYGTIIITAAPAPSGVKTYFFAAAYISGTNTTHFYLCDAASAWASRQTTTHWGDRVPDGIGFGTGFGAPSPNNSKWVLGSQHSTEWAEVEVQALFEACKV